MSRLSRTAHDSVSSCLPLPADPFRAFCFAQGGDSFSTSANRGEDMGDRIQRVKGKGNEQAGKVREAAGLGTLAATYAARKGPELFRDRVQPKLEDKGGEELASVGKKAAQQLKGSGGAMGKLAGMASGDGKKTRRLPIQRWTDVA